MKISRSVLCVCKCCVLWFACCCWPDLELAAVASRCVSRTVTGHPFNLSPPSHPSISAEYFSSPHPSLPPSYLANHFATSSGGPSPTCTVPKVFNFPWYNTKCIQRERLRATTRNILCCFSFSSTFQVKFLKFGLLLGQYGNQPPFMFSSMHFIYIVNIQNKDDNAAR